MALAPSPTSPSTGETLSLGHAGIETRHQASTSSDQSGANVTGDPFQVFELSPVHVPQLLHVWRREREAFAVETPLTCASLRCGCRSSPSVNDSVHLSGPVLGRETGELTSVRQRREIDDQF